MSAVPPGTDALTPAVVCSVGVGRVSVPKAAVILSLENVCLLMTPTRAVPPATQVLAVETVQKDIIVKQFVVMVFLLRVNCVHVTSAVQRLYSVMLLENVAVKLALKETSVKGKRPHVHPASNRS